MEDSRNLISAVLLSLAILIGWQYFIEIPKLEAQKRQQELAKQQAGDGAPLPSPQNAELADSINPIAGTKPSIERNDILTGQSQSRITIDNGRLHGSINPKGLRFDDLTLAEYKESQDEDAEEVVLLSPSAAKTAYFAEFGWVGNRRDIELPNRDTTWQADTNTLNTNGKVNFTWQNSQGLLFKVTVSLDENYMFAIKQSVTNASANDVGLYSYGIVNRVKELASQPFFILHEGPLGVMDGILEEITYEDLVDERKLNFKADSGWLGITDKYWLTALVPDQNYRFETNFTYSSKQTTNRFQTDFLGQLVQIKPGATVDWRHHFFAGAKKVGLLDEYGKQLNIELFDRAVDFGWLYFITKPTFQALQYFNKLLGNFGLAILMLTVVIKLLMFPLANKSFISMHHMKRLQPKMLEMKERYKNDKPRFQKEIMALYQKEKVNPMAGCLPLLIQIPVFFALYKVLFVTIEMRHAPFYGWITDLSAADPTNLFNAFGLIPWDPPSLLHLGFWPILMGITMYAQQRLNPQPTDPVQAKVMKMLPFIFVFLFATFPAGLVIYWTWNNILSIIQQQVINRRLDKLEKAAAAA